MKTIGFILVASRRYGGNIYRDRVEESLASEFTIDRFLLSPGRLKWRYLKPLGWLIELARLQEKRDLWIVQSFIVVAALAFSRMKGKRLAIVYHLDNSVFSAVLRPIFFVLETVFYRNLKNFDAIVTTSEYWKRFFLQKGYANVHKIYPSFRVGDFDVSEQEVADFKKRFGLQGKPIIYIGNCVKAKGVVESYEALKDLNVYLVTSGEKRVDIPATNFNLAYRDYLCLLKASSVVVTMSKFNEGWCMTAQEAMLLKRPVIGSGKGGMRELLEGGGQVVCEDFRSLKEKVEYLLSHPEEARRLGERGHEFARQFTLERFAQEWQEVIRQTIG